jgi:hypothetical protein
VKFDVTQWDRKSEENAEGLDSAIQVHVKDGVLIVPNPGVWSCHFVTDEENPIVTRIGLGLTHCGARTCPGLDGRLHSHCVTGR